MTNIPKAWTVSCSSLVIFTQKDDAVRFWHWSAAVRQSVEQKGGSFYQQEKVPLVTRMSRWRVWVPGNIDSGAKASGEKMQINFFLLETSGISSYFSLNIKHLVNLHTCLYESVKEFKSDGAAWTLVQFFMTDTYQMKWALTHKSLYPHKWSLGDSGLVFHSTTTTATHQIYLSESIL